MDEGITGIELMIKYFQSVAIFPKECRTEENSSPQQICLYNADKNINQKTNNEDLKQEKNFKNVEEKDKWNTSNSTCFPISWCIKKLTGEIGVTFTHQQYRRKGLATLATLKLVKKLQSCQELPYVYIDDNNITSITMHQKIGFVKACPFAWNFYTNP